ncbi:MAG: hypothetical protein ABIK96_13345 [bacterium]
MKHLTNPTAPRFLLWTILCVFLLALAGPGTTLARGPEYTCGSGMVEGDPTDGLEDPTSGGSGSLPPNGLSDYNQYIGDQPLFQIPCVFVLPQMIWMVPDQGENWRLTASQINDLIVGKIHFGGK